MAAGERHMPRPRVTFLLRPTNEQNVRLRLTASFALAQNDGDGRLRNAGFDGK